MFELNVSHVQAKYHTNAAFHNPRNEPSSGPGVKGCVQRQYFINLEGY